MQERERLHAWTRPLRRPPMHPHRGELQAPTFPLIRREVTRYTPTQTAQQGRRSRDPQPLLVAEIGMTQFPIPALDRPRRIRAGITPGTDIRRPTPFTVRGRIRGFAGLLHGFPFHAAHSIR